MRRFSCFLGVAACAALLVGCVDRRYVITSDPPGAVVLRNGQQLGATPVDDHFVYYGDYEFVLVKDGYQTKKVIQNIPSPWYEYFPIDFWSENVWPQHLIDVRRFHYQLEPLPAVRTDVLLNDAQRLRDRGKAITPPPQPDPPPGTIVQKPENATPPSAPPGEPILMKPPPNH